jgi:hypothetical protein
MKKNKQVIETVPEEIFLVQRLKRRDRDFKTGFDSLFELDYMGSSEFEYGSVPASLKRIRAAEGVAIEEVTVSYLGHQHTMGVIGGAAERRHFARRLETFLERGRFQENPRIASALDGGRTNDDGYLPDAWWDLNADVMFTDNHFVAEDLLRGITG